VNAARPLFLLSLQSDYKAVPVPKLDIVAVNQLLGPLRGIVITVAKEGPVADKMPVMTDNVCPIFPARVLL
jgi:hypothetical protein